MINIIKNADFPDFAELYAAKYDDLLEINYGAKYESELESLWAFFSIVDGNYYTMYFGMSSLVTDSRDIVSGQIEYIGVWSNIGPFEDTEEWDNGQLPLLQVENVAINIRDSFSSFDSEIDFEAIVAAVTGNALTFEGSQVDDGITASPGDDILNGNAGDDELEGNAGSDVIDGGVGDDLLKGGDGDDEIYGGPGDDEIYGDDGDGSDGRDLIYGGDNNDVIYGGGGDDVIFGESGDDKLYGLGGDDILYGGSGTDTLIGGEGNDYLNPMDNNKTYDSIDSGAGFDTIDLTYIVNGYVQLYYGGLSEKISVELDGATSEGLVDKGLSGEDTIISVEKPLEAWGLGVEGTDYDDQFVVTVEADQWFQVLGGKGVDVYDLSGEGSIRLDLRKGTEGAGVNLETNEISNDGYGNVESYTGVFTNVRGTNFNDTINGDANANILLGLDGNDTLIGGAGDDRIEGGLGDDTLTGGLGADTFVYYMGSGHDVITDADENDTLIGYDANGVELEDDDFIKSLNADGSERYLSLDGKSSVTVFYSADNSTPAEATGAISIVNRGTSAVPILDFYLDISKDPDGVGVSSIDVVLDFDATDVSFTSFDYADGFLGAANETFASNGKISFGAISLSTVSPEQPLFTISMENLDKVNDFTVKVSDLYIDGMALEGSTLLVEAVQSHQVTVDVTSRGGSNMAGVNVYIVNKDGTNSTVETTGSDGNATGLIFPETAKRMMASLEYENATKSVSSQDALDALKLSVGMLTAAGTANAFDYIAADFNQDGKVSSQDALAILKYSVGLQTEEQAKWVFIDSHGNYSSVSKSDTNYREGDYIGDVTSDATVSLTGVLIGDVNDSYNFVI